MDKEKLGNGPGQNTRKGATSRTHYEDKLDEAFWAGVESMRPWLVFSAIFFVGALVYKLML